MPTVIVSDRDARFTSLFWKALFKNLGTKLSMSTAFHPQTDGQTERTNRTLEQMLRIFVNYRQDNWDEQLASAEFAYNNAKQTSTKISSFFLNHGQDPQTPASLLADQSLDCNVPTTTEFVENIAKTIKNATENLQKAQESQRKYADKHRREEQFQVGDRVLLDSKNITVDVQARRPTKKLQPKFLGPFKIKKIVSTVAYELDLPATMKVHPVFHVVLLKRYQENSKEFPGRIVPPPPPIKVDDEDEFEVERILDKRLFRHQVEYLVKWKGYPEHDATWEPIGNLQHAAEVIKDFEKNDVGRRS